MHCTARPQAKLVAQHLKSLSLKTVVLAALLIPQPAAEPEIDSYWYLQCSNVQLENRCSLKGSP
jgi:hypothetical protein